MVDNLREALYVAEKLTEKATLFVLILPLQTIMPLKKPITYEDLLAQAENYAQYCMRAIGSLRPALFLIGLDGPVVCVSESITDDDSKANFATQARLASIAHGALALVLVVEAWISSAKDDAEHLKRPSEAPDRRECVVLMGESPINTHCLIDTRRRCEDESAEKPAKAFLIPLRVKHPFLHQTTAY